MSSVMTPQFRVSYPSVFKAKKNELNGKDEYGLVALFPKGTDLSMLQQAVEKAISDKWGPDKSKHPTNIRKPFRDQGERAKNIEGKRILPSGYEDGGVFITLKSAQRPGVVDQSVQPIIDETQFYAGCFARATVRVYAYDAKGNRGVAFGLCNIQKMGDGETLTGATKAEDDFMPIGQSANSANDLF